MNQSQGIPNLLFHTGRAQCPDCGATLALVDHGAIITCQYCGGTAVVERRLRTIEPVISEGFITADAPLDMGRQIQPSQIINAIAQDESHCPTCGIELETTEIQAIQKCQHCGTQSKIERRLLRSADVDEALATKEKAAEKSDRRQLDATEKLIETVETEKDLPKRVKAGWELGEYWSHINVRAARLLPRVLEVLRTCEPELEIPLGEMVGKLLCNDDVVLSNAVLRAAEKFVFDANGSHALLRNLSLGSGTGLKLLLDTADFAGARGATEYACSALWGVNTMIERNYAGRMRLAEIVLYRLLYLKGPVQAWAIELSRGQMGLGCRFPTETLLHFFDDLAAERPELLPHFEDAFYVGRANSESEFIDRLNFTDKLISPAAKIASLDHLYAPPLETSNQTCTWALQKLISMMDNPHVGPAAISAIATWIDDDDQEPRACIHDMVRAIGDKLPAEIRWANFRKVPKTPLLSAMDRNTPDKPKRKPTPFDEQLESWKQMWDTNIRFTVDRQRQRQAQASQYLAKVKI